MFSNGLFNIICFNQGKNRIILFDEQGKTWVVLKMDIIMEIWIYVTLPLAQKGDPKEAKQILFFLYLGFISIVTAQLKLNMSWSLT